MKYLEESSGRMRVLTPEEVEKYLQNADEDLHDFACVMYETGMRPDEVYRLDKNHFYPEERYIHNPFGKTKAAKRDVPLTARAFQILKRQAAETPNGWLFWVRRKKTKNENLGRVGSLRKGHDGLVAQLFLESRFVLYDFRHSFATRMVQAGCDLPTLSALLGHTKIQMTMRYVHPAQEQKRSAMDKLERLNQLELVRLVERDKSLLSRYAAGGGKESHQKSHHLIKGGKGRAA